MVDSLITISIIPMMAEGHRASLARRSTVGSRRHPAARPCATRTTVVPISSTTIITPSEAEAATMRGRRASLAAAVAGRRHASTPTGIEAAAAAGIGPARRLSASRGSTAAMARHSTAASASSQDASRQETA